MPETHIFSQDLLKSCDIRGIAGKDLHGKDAYFIGRSFGTRLRRLGKKNCIVGYDGRISSVELSGEVIRGLLESGIDVINLGLAPTPLVYFAMTHLNAHGGLIVTASHNPAEYNGFKFVTSEGPFHGSDIQGFSLLCAQADFESGEGKLKHLNIVSAYISYLSTFLNLSIKKQLSVVWDPGNGAMGAILEDFLKILPGQHEVICGDVDGTFPHHHPDPSLEENVEMLQNAVIESGADLGIAFDGDGDRIGVVDSEGYLLMGDQLLTIYARDLLKKNPSVTIMSEVKASRFFYDDVSANGGIPFMWKVGHTNQKEKMKLEQIPLAGETSGHIFFEENRGYDDGLFSSLKLLNILTHSDKSLSSIRKEFPVYKDSGEIRINLNIDERKRVISEISERLTVSGRQYVGIDGIRMSCTDGFWMMRSSNTQPHMTLRCEASSSESFEKCLADMWEQLALSGIKSE